MTCPACQAPAPPGASACAACGQPLAFAIGPGSVVADRYVVQKVLGRGGMGLVYRAHDRVLDETVALKVLRPDVQAGPDQIQRFLSEIKLARAVSHRNVCRIHEYGEDRGVRFISMAHVDGPDLRRIIREGRLTVDQAFEIAIQTADALQAIHDEGIVHRDLKAPNIMVDSRGVVKLMDFGIAKLGGTGQDLTGTGQVVGTPEYMSPEQIRGQPLDGRSDVYALGIVVYELFAGDVPFRGDSPLTTLFKHLNEPPLLDLPRVPAAVRPLLDRALAKDRAARFGSAAEMAAALRETQTAVRQSAATVVPPPTVDISPVLVPGDPRQADHRAAPSAPTSPTTPLSRTLDDVGPTRPPRPALRPARQGWLVAGAVAGAIAGALVWTQRTPELRPVLEPAPSSTVPVATAPPPVSFSPAAPPPAPPASVRPRSAPVGEGRASAGAELDAEAALRPARESLARGDWPGARAHLAAARTRHGGQKAFTELEAAVTEAERAGRERAAGVDRLLKDAETAIEKGDHETAIARYDEVLTLEPGNPVARMGRAAAVASRSAQRGAIPAAPSGRGFEVGRTTATTGEAAAKRELEAGFDVPAGMEIQRDTAAVETAGRIEFAVDPPQVRAGDPFKLTISFVNTGTAPCEVRDMVVSSEVNGKRTGGPVSPLARTIAPRSATRLLVASDFMRADARTFHLEVLLRTSQGNYHNDLSWK